MDFAGVLKRYFAASGAGQGGAKILVLLAAEVVEPF